MHFLILRAIETRGYQISADEVQTSSVTSGNQRRLSPSRPQTASVSPANDDGYAPTAEELDPDAQLVTIVNHISSETTGASIGKPGG